MLMSLSSWPTRRRPNTTGSRTAPQPFLNDSQWKLLADLFPEPQRTSRGGRPPIPPRPCLVPTRLVPDGIIERRQGDEPSHVRLRRRIECFVEGR